MISPFLLNSKYKLFQRKTKRFSGLNFNDTLPLNIFFCRSNQNFYLSTRHIDLITKYLKWKLKKSGVLAFPTPNSYPITKKPVEVWMGKGKGGIVDWTIPTKRGSIPFLFQGKKTALIKNLFKNLLKKLPFVAKIGESKHVFSQASAKVLFYNRNKILKNKFLKKKNYN